MNDEDESMVRESVFSVDEGLDGLRRFAYEAEDKLGGLSCWYRGHADTTWRLTPRIFRPDSPTKHERNLITLFKLEAPVRYDRCPSGAGPESGFAWLSLMRHYGLPTRLLDWSESILVAAHFAVEEAPRKSRSVIWALGAFELSNVMREESIINSPDDEKVAELVRKAEEGRQDRTIVCPVIPSAFDNRMLLQQSRFTIHGSNAYLDKHEDARQFLMKLIIPNEDRESLRLMLRTVGLKQSSLFPDLEHLSKDLVEELLVLPPPPPPDNKS